MKNPVCPHCGCKDTKPLDTFWRCNECHMDFGRPAESETGESLCEAVQGIRFRFGDIVAGSVRLCFAEEGQDCRYVVYDSQEGGINKVTDVLSKEQWQQLKETLINKMFLNDWKRRYLPVNDGRQDSDNNEWELTLQLPDDEEMVFEGYGAYPVYWKELLKLFNPYFNRLGKD